MLGLEWLSYKHRFLMASLKLILLRHPVVSDEVDYAGCSIFLADMTTLREKHASKCEELDVLRV
jgi:hypothetical protein